MLRYALPLLAAAALATPAQAEVEITAEGPVVELSVSESVEQRPDIAEIGAGVTTNAPTAVEAMRANADAMNAVIDRIEALGIGERDVQTSGISLHPQYDFDQQSQRQIFRGYQVMNRVSVTLRDIEQVGAVLDTLVAAGATDLSGPNWTVDDPTAARSHARERAVAAARERALEYARLAGYSDIRLLEIAESVPFDRPMPMMRMQAMDAAEESTPVRPGRVQTGVTVVVRYELTR